MKTESYLPIITNRIKDTQIDKQWLLTKDAHPTTSHNAHQRTDTPFRHMTQHGGTEMQHTKGGFHCFNWATYCFLRVSAWLIICIMHPGMKIKSHRAETCRQSSFSQWCVSLFLVFSHLLLIVSVVAWHSHDPPTTHHCVTKQCMSITSKYCIFLNANVTVCPVIKFNWLSPGTNAEFLVSSPFFAIFSQTLL